MEYTQLGATGLAVSVAALGCGGHSRLGQSLGMSEDHSVSIVHQALDAGINFIDTAESYKDEHIVGRAIAESSTPRDRVVISTKFTPYAEGMTPARVREALEKSLTALRSDYVDIYHAHGVRPERYAFVRENLVPELIKLKEEGKIRHIGVTEFFIGDPSHQMLSTALQDDIWEVVMVGLNMLNFSARRTVFPLTRAKKVGTMIMFAVRRALSRPEALVELVGELIATGKLDASIVDPNDPLGFIADDTGIGSIPEAAYRFCRHEPGADVIQTGTSNGDHLRENVRAILADDLPVECRRRIEAIFNNIDSVSGN